MAFFTAKHFKKYDSPGGRENFDFWHRLATQPGTKDRKPTSVLLLRPDAIGDFVIFARHLNGYRSMFPHARMDIVTSTAVNGLAAGTELFDQVISWDREEYEKRETYWRETLHLLSRRSYDLLIYPCYSREANADEMASVIPSGQRWAVEGDDCNLSCDTLRYNRRFYSRIVKIQAADRHESERNALIYEAFSKGWLTGAVDAFAVPMPKNEEAANRVLKDFPGPFVLVVPGAGIGFRCWPFQRFLDTVNRILRNTTASVVIGGSTAEAALCERLEKACQGTSRVLSIAGRVDIRGFVSVLSRAMMFIGNESGPAHLAGALGVPAWVIMGGGHYGRFLPDPDTHTTRIVTRRLNCFGCNWRCQQPELRCITEAVLPIEQVLAEIRTYQQEQTHNRRMT